MTQEKEYSKEIYRTGSESFPRDIEPQRFKKDRGSWPRWSDYRKKDLHEFPGATGRIGLRELLDEKSRNPETAKSGD